MGHPATGATVVLERSGQTAVLAISRGSLAVLDSPEPPRTFDKRLLRVGTAPDNDLVLVDTSASAHHFEVLQDEIGALLRDPGSTNGTFVDGQRAREVYLRDGAEITAGRTRIRFEAGAERLDLPLSPRTNFGGLLGHSPSMRAAFTVLESAAAAASTVLIEGESGTGKELAARALHDQSARRDGPYVVFDCGAASPTLIEAELFGHERGAFTGAAEARAGIFERGDGGTVVLDEIGELPLELQPKLLRALEGRTVQRIGAGKPRSFDARIVACTNRNLREELRAKRFREDLYFRLSVLTVRLPPLRERREEIPRLAAAMVQKLGGDPTCLEGVLEPLARHNWPGNVRELRNVIERLVVLPRLPPAAYLAAGLVPAAEASPGPAAAPAIHEPFHEAKQRATDAFERAYLAELLRACDHNVSEAARQSGLSRQSCHRLLQKHGIATE